MINILLNISITGGIVILLWYLSYPLSKKYFRASWHYVVLKITMLFLIFPMSIFASAPLFSNIHSGLSAKPEISDIVFPDIQIQYPPLFSQISNTDNTDNAHNTDNTENAVIETEIANLNLPYLQIIWLTVALIMFSGGIRKMHRFKKQILNSSNSNVDNETLELFLQCKKQLKMRGRINLRISEYIKTPFAFGLINPLIVLPETNMSTDEKRLAFIHELTHIKNGDLWVKFFASIISAVHWFNPLVHLLRRKISVISEEYCDECVVRTMTREERFLYGNLILKVVSDISMPQFCSTLSAQSKNLKRRLFNMINTKKSRKSMVALSVLVAFILCSFATVYAFAASPNAPENAPSDLSEILDVNVSESIRAEEKSKILKSSVIVYTYDDEKHDYRSNDFKNTFIELKTYEEFEEWFDKRITEIIARGGEFGNVGIGIAEPFSVTEDGAREKILEWAINSINSGTAVGVAEGKFVYIIMLDK